PVDTCVSHGADKNGGATVLEGSGRQQVFQLGVDGPVLKRKRNDRCDWLSQGDAVNHGYDGPVSPEAEVAGVDCEPIRYKKVQIEESAAVAPWDFSGNFEGFSADLAF